MKVGYANMYVSDWIQLCSQAPISTSNEKYKPSQITVTVRFQFQIALFRWRLSCRPVVSPHWVQGALGSGAAAASVITALAGTGSHPGLCPHLSFPLVATGDCAEHTRWGWPVHSLWKLPRGLWLLCSPAVLGGAFSLGLGASAGRNPWKLTHPEHLLWLTYF